MLFVQLEYLYAKKLTLKWWMNFTDTFLLPKLDDDREHSLLRIILILFWVENCLLLCNTGNSSPTPVDVSVGMSCKSTCHKTQNNDCDTGYDIYDLIKFTQHQLSICSNTQNMEHLWIVESRPIEMPDPCESWVSGISTGLFSIVYEFTLPVFLVQPGSGDKSHSAMST